MKKIMIVDDHAGILRLLSLELKHNGYKVITALNGKEALEKIETKHPDVILLDIIMPVMNGFEMLSRLREYSDVPVIIHSFDECNRETALKMGANDFIVKPYDMDRLLDSIERMIDGRLAGRGKNNR